MRLFVAIDLPEHLRQALGRLANGLPGARWVAPENLHLTLRFIGDIDGRQAADVDAALSAVRTESFPLALDGLGHFGEGRHVRALWVGVVPNPTLTRLHDKIEQALQRAGLAAETRKFKPHITLARFKSNPGEKLRDYLSHRVGLRMEPFEVTEFTLYSSYLAKAGAIHTPEAVYPLGSATDGKESVGG